MKCHDCGTPVHLADDAPRQVVYCQRCIDHACQQASEDVERQLALVQLSEQGRDQLTRFLLPWAPATKTELDEADNRILRRLEVMREANERRFSNELVAALDRGLTELAAETATDQLRDMTEPQYLAHQDKAAAYVRMQRAQGVSGRLRRDPSNVARIEHEVRNLMDADSGLSLADAYERVATIFPHWF